MTHTIISLNLSKFQLIFSFTESTSVREELQNIKQVKNSLKLHGVLHRGRTSHRA